ncbi:MAG: hypothetical protein Q9183_007739 [Haloplaca sp. 2 TL-2023]
MRTIPQVILQGLMDSFTAIQHLPENSRLRIATLTGIPTIVVWAQQILGLTVKVELNAQSHIFGEGPPTVYIDGDRRGYCPPEITLLNETDDAFFRLEKAHEDPILLPNQRHSVKDYGTMTLRLSDNDLDRERGMVYAIVTSCITVARELDKDRVSKVRLQNRWTVFPSVEKVLAVSKLLFASTEDVVNTINLSQELPCAARQAHTGDEREGEKTVHSLSYPDAPLHCGGTKDLLYLTHVILVLCMAQGIDEELELSLDSLEESVYMPFKLPDASRAFDSLGALLYG